MLIRYAGGFIKFAILASMGDMLGIRVIKGEWIAPKGLMYKALVWGIIDWRMVTLVFTVFMGGAAAAQASGKLPFNGSILAQAFFWKQY